MSVPYAVAYTITPEPPFQVATGAATETTLATAMAAQERREGWQDVIDTKLIEWGRNPDQLAEEDLIPPTSAAVRRAMQVARSARDQQVPPPMRTVPDGDGGIVLERWHGSLTESFEIDSKGAIELVRVCDGRVALRIPIDVGT